MQSEVKFTFDTGSDITIVDANTFANINKSNLISLQPPNLSVFGANGLPLQLLGKFEGRWTFASDNVIKTASFPVFVNAASGKNLIGIDAIDKLGLEYSKKKVSQIKTLTTNFHFVLCVKKLYYLDVLPQNYCYKQMLHQATIYSISTMNNFSP